uniref:ASXL transcriptional regulator 3 n=1 Tax=Molossus molossus TaxID=27622 RepID=A0A7J8HFF3_MOLMO|nr:ASXL transcriptional regulator 3 [Molossus molossus]
MEKSWACLERNPQSSLLDQAMTELKAVLHVGPLVFQVFLHRVP